MGIKSNGECGPSDEFCSSTIAALPIAASRYFFTSSSFGWHKLLFHSVDEWALLGGDVQGVEYLSVPAIRASCRFDLKPITAS